MSGNPPTTSAMVHCGSCGFNDSGRFCSNCSNPLPHRCGCGAQVPADARFCFACGTALPEPEPIAASTPASPTPQVGDVGLVKGDLSIAHGVRGEHVAEIVRAARSPAEKPTATGLLARAWKAFELGSSQEARRFLEEARALDPDLPGGHALMARLHDAEGEPEKALESWALTFRRSSDFSPFIEHADRTVGRLFEDAPRLISALEKLPLPSLALRVANAVVKQQRFASRAVVPLANFFGRSHQAASGLVERNRSAQRALDARTWALHLAHKFIGSAAGKEGKSELAITQIREALRYDPEDSECQAALTLLIQESGQEQGVGGVRGGSGHSPTARPKAPARSEVQPSLMDAVLDEPVDSYGARALHLAARSGSVQAVSGVLLLGGSVDVLDDDGETPLHYAAAKRGTDEIIELLIREGAEIDARSRTYGRTPLHSAAQFGNTAGARILLAHGASADAMDIAGCTPIEVARSVGATEIVALLEKERESAPASRGPTRSEAPESQPAWPTAPAVLEGVPRGAYGDHLRAHALAGFLIRSEAREELLVRKRQRAAYRGGDPGSPTSRVYWQVLERNVLFLLANCAGVVGWLDLQAAPITLQGFACAVGEVKTRIRSIVEGVSRGELGADHLELGGLSGIWARLQACREGGDAPLYERTLEETYLRAGQAQGLVGDSTAAALREGVVPDAPVLGALLWRWLGGASEQRAPGAPVGSQVMQDLGRLLRGQR